MNPDLLPNPAWPADNPPSSAWPLYTRGNIGEVYPNVVLPLEWDVGGRAGEKGWRDGAKHIGFLTDADFDGTSDFAIVGVFGGYAYFNASLMRLLGVRTPGLTVDVIDTQFLGDADVPAYSPSPGDRNLKATARMVRTAIRTLFAKDVPLAKEMLGRAEILVAERPSLDAPDAELWQYIRHRFGSEYAYFIGSHVIVTMQATIASGALTDLCEKKLGDPNLAVALTTGIGEVISAQPAREMWRLANETSDAEYDEAFADFLLEHGHRGPNEFSMGGRDWAAFPEVAEAAIDTMRGAGPDRSPRAQTQRINERRDEALASARTTLGRSAKRLDKSIANTALWSRAREASKDAVIRATQPSRHCYLELVRRAEEKGGVANRLGPLLLTESEFLAYLSDPPSLVPTIEQRLAQHEELAMREPPFAFDATAYDGGFPPVDGWSYRHGGSRDTHAPGVVLQGAAGAPGVARGIARIVTDPSDPSALAPGDILIAPLTDPSWTPLFVAAGAVVVEIGAAMSHSMIVSRELGIPCVVGVADATRRIADGVEIEVDGQAGTVRML